MKKMYKLILGLLLFAFSGFSYGQNYALQFSENPDGLLKNTVTTYGINFNGKTALSLESWVSVNNYRTGSPILFKENGNNCVAKFIAFYFFIDETGHVGLGLGNGTEFNVALSNSTIPLNEWHHVAATWDGSVITLYIDGIADGTMPAGGALYDDGLEMNVGNRWNCLRRSFDGIIDEVRVWNEVRTEAEINAYLSRELPDPLSEENLTVYYKFNTGSGNTAYDYSANGLNGQLGGVTFPSSTTTPPAWVLSGVPFFECPEIEIEGNTTVYYGYTPWSCTTLTATVTGGTGPYEYVWSNGETSQNIEVCPDETTMYSVTVTDANECSVTTEIIVEVIDVRCGWGGHKVLMCHTSFWCPSIQYNICVYKFMVPWLLYFGDQLGTCDNYKSIPIMDGIPEFESEQELQQFDQMMFEQYKFSNPGLIETGMNIYPNPVESYANVEFTTLRNENATVELYDLMGRRIATIFSDRTEAGRQYQLTFDGSQYQSGTYLLLFKQGGDVIRQKVTIK